MAVTTGMEEIIAVVYSLVKDKLLYCQVCSLSAVIG